MRYSGAQLFMIVSRLGDVFSRGYEREIEHAFGQQGSGPAEKSVSIEQPRFHLGDPISFTRFILTVSPWIGVPGRESPFPTADKNVTAFDASIFTPMPGSGIREIKCNGNDRMYVATTGLLLSKLDFISRMISVCISDEISREEIECVNKTISSSIESGYDMIGAPISRLEVSYYIKALYMAAKLSEIERIHLLILPGIKWPLELSPPFKIRALQVPE